MCDYRSTLNYIRYFSTSINAEEMAVNFYNVGLAKLFVHTEVLMISIVLVKIFNFIFTITGKH